MDTRRHLVIGGGLAGLSAATTLARAGLPVTVLEGAEHLGGRARSRHRDGFDVNLGPHALYRTTGGLAALRRLGVRPRGRLPRIDRAGVYCGGAVVGAWTESWRTAERPVPVLRALLGRRPSAAAELAGTSAADWIVDVTGGEPASSSILASVLRTATYTADHALLDAGAATAQLRAAALGVLYLHGGWSTIVDGLVESLRAAGGDVRIRSTVVAVEHDEHAVHAVRLADGTTQPAAAVVVAVNDARKVRALLDGPAAATVASAVADTVAVRMAHLDVCLRPLPSKRHPNVLGLDEPVYLTVSSSVARTAPPDGAVINVGRYLRPGEEHGDHRPGLEAMLDAAQPGWRDDVVDVRYVPHSTVSSDHARWATRGSAGRHRGRLPGRPPEAAGDRLSNARHDVRSRGCRRRCRRAMDLGGT